MFAGGFAFIAVQPAVFVRIELGNDFHFLAAEHHRSARSTRASELIGGRRLTFAAWTVNAFRATTGRLGQGENRADCKSGSNAD